MTGISATYLAELERSGGTHLNYSRARKLAAVYGCGITDLIMDGRPERPHERKTRPRPGDRLQAQGD